MASGFNLIQDQRHLMTLCRKGTLETQDRVGPIIQDLLRLNPAARALRLEIIALKVALAAAIASENFPVAMEIEEKIEEAKERQRVLDQSQKRLIEMANIELHTGTIATYLKLQADMTRLSSRESDWAHVTFKLEGPKIPKLAVKADDRKMAPTYSVKKNFEKLQAIQISWQQEYKMHRNILFDFVHKSNSQCTATLEENTWTAKLRRDRLF